MLIHVCPLVFFIQPFQLSVRHSSPLDQLKTVPYYFQFSTMKVSESVFFHEIGEKTWIFLLEKRAGDGKVVIHSIIKFHSIFQTFHLHLIMCGKKVLLSQQCHARSYHLCLAEFFLSSVVIIKIQSLVSENMSPIKWIIHFHESFCT